MVIDENKNVTPDQARTLIQACFSEVRRKVEASPAFVPETNEPQAEINEQAFFTEEAISRLSSEVEANSFSNSTFQAAESLLAAQGLSLAGIDPAGQRLLLNGVARALIEHHRFGLSRLYDPLSAYQPTDPLFQGAASSEYTAAISCKEIGPTLGQAIEAYLAAKQPQWVKKTLAARKVHLGYLSDLLGASMALRAVTPDHIRWHRKALTKLRANNGRRSHLSFQERLTENVEAQLKNKTAQLMFEPIKAFFRWAHEEEGLLATNPAANIRWQLTSISKALPKRRPFSADELVRLFGSPLFVGSRTKHRRFEPGGIVVRDAKFWIPIIGYYTGMRLGEIVQLHASDAIVDEALPFFDLNEKSGSGSPKHIKTAAGIRQVPLHPDLLTLGFADFVAERRAWNRPCKRLFSEVTLGADGQASTQFSKFFARLMDRVGLGDPTLTFHSFRHGAEDAFRNAGPPQYVIDSIMGHSDGKVSSGYGEGPSLQVKSEAVLAMKLPASLLSIISQGEGE